MSLRTTAIKNGGYMLSALLDRGKADGTLHFRVDTSVIVAPEKPAADFQASVSVNQP